MSRENLVTVVYDDEAASIVERLRARGLPGTFHACSDIASARAVIADAQVLVSAPFPHELLPAATRLQWVQSLWAGVDSWIGAPLPPGVRITRMSGIFARYMSEYVFGHLLASSLRIREFDQAQRRRGWEPAGIASLSGSLLGVAGWGHIGQRIAHLARAFDMRLRVLKRTPPTEPADIDIYPVSRLRDFLDGLDVLVLAVPATQESMNLIDGDELALLAPGATVVNVGRGGVVNETALEHALRTGAVGRAVLDTFAQEPLPVDSPLWTVPGLTVTPHISGPVYPDDVVDVVAANIVEFLDGGIPAPVAELGRGY